MAKRITKSSTHFLMVCDDRSEGRDSHFILRAPMGIYESESDAITAWSTEARFKRETSNHIIGDRDHEMIRSLFWGEQRSLWKLLKANAPMPRDLDAIATALAEEIRGRSYSPVAKSGPRRLSRTPVESTDGEGAGTPTAGKAPKRSGGGGKGGSALIKSLAEDKNVAPSKVRALLRKAGLSAPYTNEEECRKALGLG